MIFIYGGYTYSGIAIGSTPAGAAFLTPSSALFDGRSGSATSMSWNTGTQNAASFVQIAATLADPLGDSPIAYGGIGVVNCSLPAGTRIFAGGINQRLVAGARGERSAWFLPQSTSATMSVTAYNDVNGASPFTDAQTWAIGEIIVGRVLALPMISCSVKMVDPTGYNRSSGQQLWQYARKPYRVFDAVLGPFTTTNAKGGAASLIASGASPAGVIDVVTFRDLLTTMPVLALCDTPSAGNGAGSAFAPGGRDDTTFMQPNFTLVRMSDPGTLTQSQFPYWTWNPQFMEAT